VTGASRGIGKAIALEFARNGADVVMTWNKDREGALRAAQEARLLKVRAYPLRVDVTERQSVRDMFKTAIDMSGGVDVLVNNAGYLEQKPFCDITDHDWDRTVDTNLKGVFLCIQEGIEGLTGRKGSIINVSSVGGQTGGTKAPHYAAAKAGVISLTKSMARILAPAGIRVNAIAPGFIRTDMYDAIASNTPEAEILCGIPLGFVGEASDIAHAALFLASDAARYITGHVLNVNGGLHIGSGA